MASSSDGGGSNGALARNFSLSTAAARDYEGLKQQLDKANSDLTTLRRRCDHAMKLLKDEQIQSECECADRSTPISISRSQEIQTIDDQPPPDKENQCDRLCPLPEIPPTSVDSNCLNKFPKCVDSRSNCSSKATIEPSQFFEYREQRMTRIEHQDQLKHEDQMEEISSCDSFKSGENDDFNEIKIEEALQSGREPVEKDIKNEDDNNNNKQISEMCFLDLIKFDEFRDMGDLEKLLVNFIDSPEAIHNVADNGKSDDVLSNNLVNLLTEFWQNKKLQVQLPKNREEKSVQCCAEDFLQQINQNIQIDLSHVTRKTRKVEIGTDFSISLRRRKVQTDKLETREMASEVTTIAENKISQANSVKDIIVKYENMKAKRRHSPDKAKTHRDIFLKFSNESLQTSAIERKESPTISQYFNGDLLALNAFNEDTVIGHSTFPTLISDLNMKCTKNFQSPMKMPEPKPKFYASDKSFIAHKSTPATRKTHGFRVKHPGTEDLKPHFTTNVILGDNLRDVTDPMKFLNKLHTPVYKELDYYRSQHRAAMNQLEVSSQDSASLRTKYGDVLSENQRLEQDIQSLRTELSELHRQQEVLVSENGNSESFYMLARRNEAVRDDYDALRKRFDELLASHSQAITKLEMAQDETMRLNKQCDEINQERNNAMREIVNLRQQVAVVHGKYDKMARDCVKYREAFQKVQQQYEEAVKEVNQAMAFRMKASKEVKRLTDERNAAMTEYNLIMSERDTVHKEMEKLSDDLTQSYKKTKLLEADNKELLEEKKQLNYQMETLRREIASALHDRDKALKECNDLREKFGEYNASKEDSRDSTKSRLDHLAFLGENAMRNKEVQANARSLSQRQRLDNLDQANQELESLRKSLDKAQTELSEAIQEAEVSKGRRDWAFSERDKIVLERESIRTLCDNMRKERDRAVSELAEALRESDAIKKQRNELVKEVKLLKEALETHVEKEAQFNQFHGLEHNNSHDSAIDSDMQEWETEILEMDLSDLPTDGDLGFELVGGRDEPHYQNDSGIYVACITKGSIVDGKLRANDCIARVNNLDCTSVSKHMVIETLRSSHPVAHIVIRRRRSPTWSRSSQNVVVRTPPSFQNNSRVARWIYTARLAAGCHGLSLESGVYISKISEGSLAARDNSLVVGDRVLSINNKSMDGIESIHEAMSILNDDRTDIITITTLKTSYLDPECTTNVFMPAQRYKKENRSSQTEEWEFGRSSSSSNYVDPRRYPLFEYRVNNNASSGSGSSSKGGNTQEKHSGAWFREKLDMVRGRRHSKERTRSDEKKKYRNSSPNTLDLGVNTYEQEQAIAELDLVIDSYHGDSASGANKRNKRHDKALSIQEKNGGTWPKARATQVLQNATGTIVERKRERPPLSVLLTNSNRNEGADGDDYCCARNPNRNSTPLSPLPPIPPHATDRNLHRHTVYKSMDNSGQFSMFRTIVNDSFEKLRRTKVSDFEANARDSNRMSINSDNSLEFPVGKPTLISEKDFLNYHKRDNKPKYGSDSERDNNSLIAHDLPLSNASTHSRMHSQLFAPQLRVPFPFHPHHHTHAAAQSLSPYPSSQLRESFCFEPPYLSLHSHSPSEVNYANNSKRPGLDIPQHLHVPYRDTDMLPVVNYVDGQAGTFPRKNPRFRIPSNPSVTSKNSTGKVSTGSIERTSERGSPMPIFQVEVLSPGNRDKRNSIPDYCWPQKPLPGELRRVHIDKSNEPLGIQINCPESGGIFVSTVNENSLASRVGLQIGDQLLEVCGINMRNATYNLAASVLRQCGNSITMLVQYSPDKYHELQESGSCSASSSNEEEEDVDGEEPTPCNSPKGVRKSRGKPGQLALKQQQHVDQRSGQQQQQQGAGMLQRQVGVARGGEDEPRYLYIETLKTSNLGISLVGGNAVGIFIHSVQPDSLAYHAGLRTGDQILEYNGTDLRHATAEEAAYELAKPADKVTVLSHYRIDRYHEIKDKPGDSLYIRCLFDRSSSEITDNLQLCFNKDDILYIDNTMFNGVPGHWRAWKLDSEGHRQQCGIIASKYKVEEELLLKRSTGDLETRGVPTARRSFFRRKKHQRNGSRDSKELASFCNVSSGWYSDNGTLHEDLSLCSYQRVEKLDYPEFRPVLILGPLAECVVDKLVNDFPDKFQKVQHEVRHCSQAALDQEMNDNLIVDYRRKMNYFECTTVSAIRSVCSSQLHCMLDLSVSSVEKLHRHQIYPIVLLIKFKSTKQIKEVKDTRYPLDKLSGKAAKEMYEHGLKLEVEYRHQISAVIPAGVNLAYMCTQVKAAIVAEHHKSQWVPVQ